jgi:hypothetical protein
MEIGPLEYAVLGFENGQFASVVLFAGGMVAPQAMEKVSAELAAAKEENHA